MGTQRPTWEKMLMLTLSILFATVVTYSLPRHALSLSFFIVPIILAASYYGLPGGIGCAVFSIVVAASLGMESGVSLGDPQMITQVILFLLVGAFSGFMEREQERTQAVLHRASITDELTGLYNYHYFRTRIDEEVKRSKRYGHSLSLMMCDVNHFKHINDTLGHANGNFILNKMASLIRDAIRESDISFRYGGDEFAVILPETGHEAREVAERIIGTVNKAFATEDMSETLRPSLTAGVAVRDPEEPLSAELLISCADQALYKAKRAGVSTEVFSLSARE